MHKTASAIFVIAAFLALSGRSGAATSYTCPKVRPVTVRCVRGTIIDQAGEPVSLATVALLRDHRVLATMQTDQNGEFSFQSVEAGHYDLRAEYPGFLANQYPIVVSTARKCKRSLEMVINVGASPNCPNARVVKR